MKFPDVVKVLVLFYDYFHHEKFPNIPVSLVSQRHSYKTRSASSSQIFIPSFRSNLRRFCPSICGCFFWKNIPQFICADTLLNTNEKLSFHYLPSYFPSLFKCKSRLLSHVVVRGMTLVCLMCSSSLLSNIPCKLI